MGPLRWYALAVLAMMVANALLGALGVGVVLPVFEFLGRGAQPPAGSVRYFAPLLDVFPRRHHTVVVCLAVVLLFAFKNAVHLLSVWLSARFTFRLRESWSERLSRRYLFERYARFIQDKQGVVINNLVREPAEAANALGYLLESLSAAILAAAIFALACLVSWRFVLGFSVLCGLLFLLLRRVTYEYSVRMGVKRLRLYRKLSAHVAETVAAMKEIKLLCSEELRQRDMLGILGRIGHLKARLAVVNAAPQAVGELTVICLFMAAVFVAITRLEVSFQEMLPQLAFFFVAFTKLFLTVSNLFAMRMRALNVWPSLELVQRLVRETPEPEDQEQGLPITALETGIVWRDVGFAFEPGRPVLSGLNLTIARGKVNFIVGPSGAGKSTIVDLLVRLYAPDHGVISANGRDIRDFRLRDWRAIIGYVGQDAFLFNGTVRENILIGNPRADEDALERAARAAGVEDFVSALPQGCDTPIGDRGLAVSGGQRKRIAIARALVRAPQLLILDEATSSFEQQMEEQLFKRLQALYPDMTVIHITHRLSGAARAEQVVVIEEGKVAAAGRWEDVMGRKVAAR